MIPTVLRLMVALLLSGHGLPGGPSPRALPPLASHTRGMTRVMPRDGMPVSTTCQIVAGRATITVTTIAQSSTPPSVHWQQQRSTFGALGRKRGNSA